MIGKIHVDRVSMRSDEDGNLEYILQVASESKYNARMIYHDIKSTGKPVTATFDLKRNRRTLDQNRLLWALLEIMALAQNGGRLGGVTAWDCYIDMLEKYGAKYEYFMCIPEAVDQFRKSFRAVKEVERRKYNGKEMVVCKCFYGSSQFDTAQMSMLIDGVFDELAEMDIDAHMAADVAAYHEEWRRKE